jgi:N-acetylmuramoyl-L-alanine amidase
MIMPYSGMPPLVRGLVNKVMLIPLALLLAFFAGPAGIMHAYAADNARTIAKNQAGKMSTATLRVGKHPHYLRLVFETQEIYVQKASVSLTGADAIKVDFQSPISFRVPQKDAPKAFIIIETGGPKRAIYEIDKGLKITADISSCIIYVDKLDDINVSKLSSPSRLVIDAYISQEPSGSGEKETAEAPLTVPDASEIKVESFVIDAGHGGYESGVHFGKTVEKDLALSIAKELAGALLKKSKKVVLTRKGDQMVSLKDRARIVNRRSPELLVSIHVSSKNEFVVYIVDRPHVKAPGDSGADSEKSAGTDRSEVFAQAIAQSARSALKVSVRNEKMPLRLLSSVHVPAVLIELPSPEKFSYDVKSRERLVVAILQGIAYSSAGQVRA